MWAVRAATRRLRAHSLTQGEITVRHFSAWRGHARDRKTNLSGMHDEESYTAADEAHSFEARARRDRKTASESTSEFEELPVGYSCTVYHSPDSMLVRGLGALMALNGVGAAGATLLAAQDELTKMYAIFEAAEMNNTAPSDFLLSTTMPLPNIVMPGIMLGISVGMFKMASIALKKVCTGLQRVIDQRGVECIDVTHMTLLGHGSRRYLREDCEGSRDTKVSQNFAVLDTRNGGPPVYYLFPVGGWWSDDIDFLKTFLFEKFFRPEPTPPPDADLIAIEGFGGFRPAQLADPTHPASRQLAWPVSPDSIKDTPFYLQDGHVYTHFQQMQSTSPEQARARELSEKVFQDKDVQRARDRTAASLAEAAASTPPDTPSDAQPPNDRSSDSDTANNR